MTLLRTLRLLHILEWTKLKAILRQVCSHSASAFTNVCLHFRHRCSSMWNWNGVWIAETFPIWGKIKCDIEALRHKAKVFNVTFGCKPFKIIQFFAKDIAEMWEVHMQRAKHVRPKWLNHASDSESKPKKIWHDGYTILFCGQTVQPESLSAKTSGCSRTNKSSDTFVLGMKSKWIKCICFSTDQYSTYGCPSLCVSPVIPHLSPTGS